MTDIEYLEAIGKRIEEVRSDKFLSQRGLAKEMGVSRMQLRRIESGKTSAGILTLKKIADTLNIEVHQLLKIKQ